jgi:hypothetical protein
MVSCMTLPFGGQSLPGALVFGPFQLFVLHKVQVVEAQNPGSTSSVIMSQLDHMWQALPVEQKLFYACAIRDLPRRSRTAPTRTADHSSKGARGQKSTQQQDEDLKDAQFKI